MSVVTYTAGDSEPAFDVTVLDRNGQALDMTFATAVEFRAKATASATIITRPGTFVDRLNGKVRFIWTTTDLANIGIYNVQVRVTWSAGRWSNHPNNTYDTLIIQREVES